MLSNASKYAIKAMLFLVLNTNKKNGLNTVCDILFAIDGHELFDECFMELDKCDAQNPCPVHNIVAEFKENLYKKFKEINLIQFANDTDATSRFLKLKTKG